MNPKQLLMVTAEYARKAQLAKYPPFHLSTPFLSEEKAQSCDIAWLRQLSAILSTSLLEP